MRPQKITFGEMRDEMGVSGVLVYCAEFRCGHSMAMNADRWPDDLRLSDIEPRFVCAACGKRGADVRPDFNGNTPAIPAMGPTTSSLPFRALTAVSRAGRLQGRRPAETL